MYLYISIGSLLLVGLCVILLVALTIEKDRGYRRHRTYSEFFEDEV
jgi:hypothetical protein